MGALLDEFKRELSVRQSEPGFDKDVFKTEFLAARGRKRTPAQPARGRGLPEAESRGVVSDVVSGAARGITGAAEMYMRAVRAFDPKGGTDIVRDISTKGLSALDVFVERHPFLKPSKEAESGLRRALTEGTTSFVESAAAIFPGLAAGLIVPPAAPFVGAAGGAAIFGAAEKDRFDEEVETYITSHNLTDAQAADLREKGQSQAIKSALVEGGFELAANTLQVLTLGLFKPFKGVTKEAAKTTFKALFKQPGSAIVRGTKAYLKTAATEVGTETAQEALETKFRRDIGITDMSSLEAATSVIAPTLVTSLLFLGSAKGINSLDRRRIKKGLEEAQTIEGKPASKAKRKKAVDAAVAVVAKTDKAKAAALRRGAHAYVDAEVPIDLSTEFGVIEYVGQISKSLNDGGLNVLEVQKLADGISNQNPALSSDLSKIATAYRIQNSIPDMGETAQPAAVEDLADTMINGGDVDLEAVISDVSEIEDAPDTEEEYSKVEKAVDEALEIDSTPLEAIVPEDEVEGIVPVAEMESEELEQELADLRRTFPAQEEALQEIQQERINEINEELGEREGEEAVQEERKRVLEEVEEPKAVELEPRVAEFREPEPTKERKKAQREGLVEPTKALKAKEKVALLKDLKSLQEEIDKTKEGEVVEIEEVAPEEVVSKIREQIAEDATPEQFEALITSLEEDIEKAKEPEVVPPTEPTALQKGVEITTDEELDVLLGTIEPEKKVKLPAAEKAKEIEPKATQEEIKKKTATTILSDASKSGVKGVDSAVKGLFELFGGANIKSFPAGLDKESYAKAKPHFETAFKEFSNAGKSLKEFLQFAVNNFGNGIKPYLKVFVQEQRKGIEAPVEEVVVEKPKIVEVGEPEVKIKPVRPKRIRMKDVGEVVPGKRSNKDNFERIKEELAELATGNTNKDLNRILNRAVRNKIWKIEAVDRPTATPGTLRYLKMVRNAANGVTVYAAGKLGGVFTGTSKQRLESYADVEETPGDRSGYNEIAAHVARYENSIEMLNAATATATTVKEAHDNIVELVASEDFKKGDQKGTPMFKLSDEGKEIMDLFEWGNAIKVFRAGEFITDEQADKPEPKQLRRTRIAISEMERENVPDHRKEDPNPTAQDFIDKFGFRAAEFGEYVDSKSGRRHINLSWDSFHDLAEVLKVPLKAASVVSGDRHLAMAFGARGRGRHSAHYEPSTHLVNMTKNNGDGSLSHEWAHALDDALSRTTAGKNAISDVGRALNTKFDVERARAEVEEILTGNSYWTSRTSKTPIEVARDFLTARWKRYVRTTTAFAQKSAALGEYWNRSEEKFARGFEAFIYDSLEGSSPYLVSDWVDGSTTDEGNGYRSNPYPAGEEREQFNRVYKHFTDGINWTTDGVPTMKDDYVLVTEQEEKIVEAEMQKMMDKLDDMYAAMHQGKESKDGLWWYEYTATQRAAMMQPKDINAYDDKFGDKGAVAYTDALLPDDILYYKLKAVTNDVDDNKVYLKEKEDAEEDRPRDFLDTAGLEGEAALGEVSPEDGEGAETGAGVPRRTPERSGELSDSPSEPSESGGSRPPSPGEGIANVDTSTGGTPSPEVKSGSDAVLGGGNYRITESDRVGQGTTNEKFTNNIAAIRTLKEIEREGRAATREEQAVLVKYVGWGGMSKVFDKFAEAGWADKAEIVTEALTDEEYNAARASTLSAFYTSPEVVSSVYEAMQKFGVKGGRVLEPAVGTGNFLGMLPEVMIPSTQLAGVEMDNISSRIAKQLYQRASIFNSPYEKSQLPRNFYDMAISNVPFEDTIPFDRVFNKKRFKLHDYYFTKTLELVRPGGVIGFITSAGTMDKVDAKARKVMENKADFIGAIRLPDTAFKDAGTKVTADIIFLRRKGGEGKAIPAQKWAEIKDYVQKTPDRPDETYKVNEYFANNPDMMLGQMSKTGRWDDSQNLMSDGRDIEEALKEAVEKLPSDIYTELENTVQVDIADLIPEPNEIQDGSYYEEGGKLFTHIAGEAALEYKEETPHQKKKGRIIREFIKLRAARRAMLKAQAKEESEEIQKKLTKKLNTAYDAFVKKFGFINEPVNLRAIIDDPDAPRILALENWDEETGEATKSDIFSKKFIEALKPITSVDKPGDAVPHSLNTFGRVDIPYIANLSGVSEDEAIRELEGEIWNDPEKGWVISDEYLSGNIKEKIALAEQAAKTDPIFKKNIEALTPLIPPDLPPSKITANLGAPWIEKGDIQEFIRDLIPQGWHIHVDYVPELGRWKMTPKAGSNAEAARQHASAKQSVAASATWGTSRKNFFDLMENILNGGLPTVRDAMGTDPQGKPLYIVNPAETDAAQAKLEAIKEKFGKWIWQDDDRQVKYVRKYNDVYNATRERAYNGDHLTFPGKVPDDIITMGKHQKDAVWRAISSGLNTYFGHEVGTGKTYVMTATIMEAKRLGLKKKPLVLGVKANIDELAENFVKLYPAARILRLDISGNTLKRKIQLNRIANNEWDAVIITHDSFKNIQLSPEGQSEAMEEELGNLRLALAMAQEGGAAKFTVKEIEKKIKVLATKQEELMAQLDVSKIGLDFEELGVDMLVVDEAHIFKNIPYATRHSNIVGISGDGSALAFDLHMKTRWINEKFGGGIILASGTPITNSVAEIYNVSRYLNPQTLRDKGIHTFDAWAAAFGNITQTPEFAPEGGGYRMVRKFKEFVNIPELRSIIREVMDVVTVESLDLKVPKMLGGRPIAVLIPQNEMVEALGQEMLMRAKDIRGGGINQQPRHPDKVDIMLSVISDGRNGAIDMRLVDPALPDHPDTKANHAIRNIFQSWTASKDINGTQLVFADRGVPGKGKVFDVYNDIKAKLIKMGIPEAQIAFPRNVKGNKLKKKRLMAQINSGAVRVVIGSTPDMGIGVNAQERGVAIHNLDTEWTFERLEQRRGRFIRQGNILYEFDLPVGVFNYMTEGTVDAFMWDKVAAKKATTEVVLFGNSEVRSVEDVSQDSASAAEMMAIASGDPRFLRKIELEAEVRKLNAIRGNWEDERYRLKRQLGGIPGVIEAMETGIAHREDGQKFFGEINAVRIGDVLYDLKRHAKEITEKMEHVFRPESVKRVAKSANNIPIATYGRAITEEIETEEEVTTVTTVKGEKVEVKEKKKKVNKIMRWDGNDISIYARGTGFVSGEFMAKALHELKIGTKTKYGQYEMVASGGLARLLSNTKATMEREISESKETIEKKEKEREDITKVIGQPFEQEQEHTDKNLELKNLTQELGQLLQEQQEEQGKIDPDLERFKTDSAKITDVTELDIPEEDVSLSLKKKENVKSKEGQYWDVTAEIAQAVVDGDIVKKEELEKKRTKIQEAISKEKEVAAKAKVTRKTMATGQLADIYADLFREAERVLGRGKADFSVVTQAEIKKDPKVVEAALERGITEKELLETYDVKGSYQGVEVDGVAVRGVIRIAADGIRSIEGLEKTVRHEIFHGVFERLLNKKDRNIVLERYKTEERAADAFAEHVTEGKKLVPVSVKTIFGRVLEFFESFGNLLKGRGFKNAGDIFGAAAAGELVDKQSTVDGVGNVSLSIEKGVPEEDLNAENDKVRQSLDKMMKSSNPVFRQYAMGLRGVMTQNPANVQLNKTHSAVVDEIYANVKNTDIKWHERMFGLPFFLAKKYNEWNSALGIEIKREEDRSLMISEFNKKVGEVKEGEKDQHEIMGLKTNEEESVLLAVYEGDASGKVYTDTELRKGIRLETLGELDEKQKGKVVSLTDRQIAAYKSWHTSTDKMKERVLEAIDRLVYLPYENQPWVEHLKASVKRHELQRARQKKVETETGKVTDFSELTESELPQRMKEVDKKLYINAFNKILPKQVNIASLRRAMGEVKGYAPRVRQGKYVVTTYDNGGQTIWSERSEKEKDTKGFIDTQIKRMQKQGFVLGKDFVVRKEVKDKPSEFIFDQIQAVSVERFVNKALNQAKTNEKISEADIDAVSEEMITLLSDEFKGRGFGARMMKRKEGFPIGGYDISNIKRRYAEYITGASGYITKQVAAFEYATVLRNIDINTKPDLYEDIAKYSGDMLRNTTRLDRISGRVRTAAFVWYLAGQLKSPVVNFTQNWILGIPLLEKETGKGAKGLYHKAMADVARRKYTDQEKKFMQEMAERGITGDQLTKEITGQAVAESGKAYESVVRILATPFSLSEVYNRKSSALAMFRAAIAAGDDYRTAFDKSRKFIFNVHFMYGKLNAPSGARGGTPGAAILRTSLTFRNYTFNFMHAMKDMLSERDFKTVAKAMTYMALLGGASALPFLDGFLDMLERQFGWAIRKEVKKELEAVGGEVLATVGIQGLPALIGADISGSLRIHFPDVTDPGKLIEESVFGVYEGLAMKGFKAVQAATTGQFVRAFEMAAPTFIERPIKAIREREGLTTTRGRIIKDPTGKQIVPDIKETIATGLGFRPSRIARLSDNYRQFQNISKFYSDWRGKIYTNFRLAKTFEARQKVLQDVVEYNRSAIDQEGAVSLIKAAQLKAALRERIDKRLAAFSQ
jgi:N12 class adenine-specific DNA methylase/phospholipid N-methyltransferase